MRPTDFRDPADLANVRKTSLTGRASTYLFFLRCEHHCRNAHPSQINQASGRFEVPFFCQLGGGCLVYEDSFWTGETAEGKCCPRWISERSIGQRIGIEQADNRDCPRRIRSILDLRDLAWGDLAEAEAA